MYKLTIEIVLKHHGTIMLEVMLQEQYGISYENNHIKMQIMYVKYVVILVKIKVLDMI
jgi:hypothetical protein